MTLLSWNYRGLGNPCTVRDLCRLVKTKKPNLVFLMETKSRNKRMETVRVRIGFANLFVVECIGKSGGLALLWNDEINVEIQNFSRHHINAKVTAPYKNTP
jgi:exonuclease III